jgi:NADPH-dependent glutamate synthase beta subunit-like oxidoreductase
MIYRRTRKEMPASDEEIEGCIEEGINIIYLAAPDKIWKDGNLIKLRCLRMKLGELDASGRQRPVSVEGSEFTKTYDTIIAAIGQMTVIPTSFNIEIAHGSRLAVSNDNATIKDGVFGGGDAVSGPATIIEAIAAGRHGAVAIDRYLGGKGIIDEQLAPVTESKDWLGCGKGYALQPREKLPCILPKERLNNFDIVEHNYSEESALKEANRCLQCDLRLKISFVKLPPKRETTKNRSFPS